MNVEEIVGRAAYSRPGYRVVHYREAALPLFVVRTRLLVLSKKPLTAIEEACLNAIGAGLATQSEISGFLGLVEVVTRSTLADLSVRELINVSRTRVGSPPTIALTSKGRSAREIASTIAPVERTVPVVFDPFLQKIVYRHRSSLFSPKETRDNGWTQIPLGTRRKPQEGDISIPELSALASRRPGISEKGTELLAVSGIERRDMHFNPVVLLFFAKEDGSDVRVALSIDGDLSIEHERALSEAGVADLLGARLVVMPAENSLPICSSDEEREALAKQALIESEIAATITTSAQEPTEATAVAPVVDHGGEQKKGAEQRLDELTFRIVRCWQHPDLLWRALKESTTRLLIISPWIRDKVVNRHFLVQLEHRLKAGVLVHIGYGLEDDKKESIGVEAKKGLERLARDYPNFRIKYLGNTHRKFLISDDRFAVVTSFNWLSFRGDANMPARDEGGILNSNPAKVEMVYADAIALIEDGYRHPTEFGRKPR